MKKFAIILLLGSILALGACKSNDVEVPAGVVSIRIPDAPPELLRKAEPLPELTDPSMGGLVIDGVETDILYNDVGFRYNKLIDFYNCVQKSINEKKDPDQCLNR